MGNPDRVRVVGPLSAFNGGFAAELVRLGYRPNAAANQLQLMAHLSRWMAQRGLEADKLTASVLAEFLAARRDAGYRLWLSPKALSPLLSYLRGLGVVPAEPEPQPGGAAQELLVRYRGYLVRERGLSPATARLYAHLTSRLLVNRMSGGELDLASLTAADVIGFVRASCPGHRVGTAKLIVTASRSLLGYLHVQGMIGLPLASAVPSVAGGARLGLPQALDRDAVALLLSCCDRNTAAGRRDYAMLTLLVRLGLRAGEVASLRLDDIDWRAGELAVVGKGNRIERLPLPVDVGEAVADYLRDGRPATAEGRTVFVRTRAPHRSLSVAGVTDAVSRTAQRAGLGCVRARQLRHTAATAMVREGATLPDVGQVLRHRRLLTTSIYAKVDTEALRELARPWPGGAA
ncbi:MAG TPA: site-specific integrase [Mycobacterium sp.]